MASDREALPRLFGSDDRGAEISDCGRYRYLLWRTWGDEPPALFVMFNPSTADAEVDDRTIGRCIGFARSWGLGGIRVVNLYAWRATHPTELNELGPTAIGEMEGTANLNDEIILREAREARRIIAAWGAATGPVLRRPSDVLGMLTAHGHGVQALKLTSHGHPWHPLYVPGDVVPFAYPERAEVRRAA